MIISGNFHAGRNQIVNVVLVSVEELFHGELLGAVVAVVGVLDPEVFPVAVVVREHVVAVLASQRGLQLVLHVVDNLEMLLQPMLHRKLFLAGRTLELVFDLLVFAEDVELPGIIRIVHIT